MGFLGKMQRINRAEHGSDQFLTTSVYSKPNFNKHSNQHREISHSPQRGPGRGTSLISQGGSFNVIMRNLSAVSLTDLHLVQLIKPEKKKKCAVY